MPRQVQLGRISVAVIAAVAAGIAGGKMWQSASALPASASASAIEWNEVQAVPTRTPDIADIAWEKRARELDEGAVGAADEAPAVSNFGYCKWGGGTNCVVDGDTFYFNGEKVRIAGIDAPETHPSRCAQEERLGNAATKELHDLLNSGTVTLTSIDRDRDPYGRLLRNVAVDGRDVGEAMISAGVAREYAGGRRPWC